jgi:hypothetical protein
MSQIEKWAEAIKKHEGWYVGSRSYRNNNPGNFRCAKWLMEEFGGTCVDNFIKFPTYETGWKALTSFLTYACEGALRSYKPEMTLLDFYKVYAPSADGNSPKNYATAVAKDLGVSINTQIKEFLAKKPMRIHLYGHMDKNFVRKGDKVIKYVTPIGTLGDGNGQYYAHLHFSISEGLTPQQLKTYIKGWSKEKVEQFYREPKDVDFTKMFGRKMDVGNFGYGWLDWVGYGFHPGVDVNGLFGGNSDFGYVFKSSCDGVVIWEERTWFKNAGWGNICLIAES